MGGLSLWEEESTGTTTTPWIFLTVINELNPLVCMVFLQTKVLKANLKTH
jgi:hypothetical protein